MILNIIEKKENNQKNSNIDIKSLPKIEEKKKIKKGFSNTKKPNQKSSDESSKKLQIISSLFTSNPSLSVPEALKPDLKTDYEPSNGLENQSEECLFQKSQLSHYLVKHLKNKLQLKQPTLIQQKSLQVLIPNKEKKDLFIHSQTGSGKTLAYLLPILHHLLLLMPNDRLQLGTKCIILCPTRELANQVHLQLQKLLSMNYPNRWIVDGLLTGGEKKKSEKARLRKGISVLVATPGRLLDHLKTTQSFSLHALEWLVLDEGDKMVQLGFQETINEIHSILKDKSKLPFQTILCSATQNDQVVKFFQQSAFQIVSAQTKEMAPNQMKQYFLVCPAKQRLVLLICYLKFLLKNGSKLKIIIFFSNCAAVDFHYQLCQHLKLFENTFQLFKLHASLAHSDRLKTLNDFSKSSQTLLFTTDVAARGLDMPDITHIIQYHPATDLKEYIHRIGRTARLGKQGEALLFLLPSEVGYLGQLKEEKISLQEYTVDYLLNNGLPGKTSREEEATQLQGKIEQHLKDDEQCLKLSKLGFQATVRAYTTYPDKKVFHQKLLHLGHLAKSFGLREAPSQLMEQQKKKQPKKEKRTITRAEAFPALKKFKVTSEFDSGL